MSNGKLELIYTCKITPIVKTEWLLNLTGWDGVFAKKFSKAISD